MSRFWTVQTSNVTSVGGWSSYNLQTQANSSNTGPPCTTARYEILRSSVAELLRTGILRGGVLPLPWDAALAMQSCGDNQHTSTRLLLDVAAACDGGSGRLLRKLPLLAHAALRVASDVDAFLVAMKAVAAQEADDRTMLQANHLAAA